MKAAEALADGKVPRRRRRTSKEQEDGLDVDTGDDYDMICVRGGSPQHLDAGVHSRLQHHDKAPVGRGSTYYRSDDSYDSSAYDSFDDRKRKGSSFVNKDSRHKGSLVSRKSNTRTAGSKRRAEEDSEVDLFHFVMFSQILYISFTG